MKIEQFIALVVFSLATVAGAQSAVLAGPVTNAITGHAYYLLSEASWTDSETEARGLGGHLVTINSAAENQWVMDTVFPLLGVAKARIWIGLNDVANEGQFVWASGEPVAFTHWAPGEPNNTDSVLGNADHVAISPNYIPAGVWSDFSAGVIDPVFKTFGVVEVSPSPPVLPVAVTQPADQFLPGSVRLSGQANPNGSTTLAWFEWGTSTGYGNTTPPQSVGSGDNAVGFSNVLTGLTGGLQYHFRAVASNAFGLAVGLNQTFDLNSQEPVATTLAAELLYPTSTRLSGQVNPHGSSTLAWFEWGTSLAFGNTTTPQSIGSGDNAVGFSNVLAGLTTGTEYHFRAVATNAFGFVVGEPQSFKLNTSPQVVTWISPAHGATFVAGSSIQLMARVERADLPVSFLEFFAASSNQLINLGRGFLFDSTYYLLHWANGPVGTFRVYAEAVDNLGFRVVSGSVQITINPPPPPPPTWTGADPSGYWSAPANWLSGSVPTNGADLVFPGGLPPEDMVSTNDLTDSFFRSITFGAGSSYTIHGQSITLTNRRDCILNAGTNVIACDLTLSGTPSTPQMGFTSIRSSGFPSGQLTVIGNVGGSALWVGTGMRLTIQGQFTGGSLLADWGSTLALYGDNPREVAADVWGSKLLVQGSQPNLNIRLLIEMESPTGGSLSGDAEVGNVVDAGGLGIITPDSTLSAKNVSATQLTIRLNGTNPGEYSRLVASGTVGLSRGRLLPSAGFHPQAGQVFTILEKTSPGAIANPIFGPEGSFTTLNGMPFRISYVGGDGNDVTLTAMLPRLNIARTSDATGMRLSWPTNFPGYRLQRAGSINGLAPFLFQDVLGVPLLIGGDYSITTPASTSHEFFRLKRD